MRDHLCSPPLSAIALLLRLSKDLEEEKDPSQQYWFHITIQPLVISSTSLHARVKHPTFTLVDKDDFCDSALWSTLIGAKDHTILTPNPTLISIESMRELQRCRQIVA